MSSKQPKQERSRVMFRSILEATTQLLNKVSDGKLTTRAIADRAGVSVGSLYQYFTSADSILGEVLRDQVHRDVEVIWTQFQHEKDLALEARMESVFLKILETHVPLGRARTTLLLKSISLHLVEFARDQVESLSRRMFAEVKAKGEVRADLDSEMAIYLLSRTVFSVTMSATVDHEKMLHAQKDLARELARMIAAYLRPSP
jgi:AcrR family transcriptional regulator